MPGHFSESLADHRDRPSVHGTNPQLFLGHCILYEMIRLYLVPFLALLPTAALSQPANSDVPRPGTIQDPTAPVKTIADGPPRPLIRADLPETQDPVRRMASSTIPAR